MKKLKKLYKENRVFTILMAISLTCLLIIIVLVSFYLFSSTSKSKYGNRLDGINDVLIEENEQTELENKVSENAGVEEVKVNLHGKIIYFDIKVNNDIKPSDCKKQAEEIVTYFDDDYLNYYDIHFMFSKSNDEAKNFPILGYRKVGAKKVSFSYNAQD